MKPGLQVGDVREVTVMVDERSAATLQEQPVHPLYGTAGMVAHMEWAARQHILPYLEEDEEGVGFEVEVRHLKPAPLNATIRVVSRVIDLPPKRVISQVEAWWKNVKVGEGTITQALVSRSQLYASVGQNTDRETLAVLTDEDARIQFTLRILEWEHEGGACTRYDEWLKVRLSLDSTEYEGACLLRYELEEWQLACENLATQTQDAYQSDFLDPVLTVSMQADGAFVRVKIILNRSEQSPDTLCFLVDSKTLKHFSKSLELQLERFPSQL